MKLSCHILDLRVHILLPNGEWRWLSIDESPYALYLLNDCESVYTDYGKLLRAFRSFNWRNELPLTNFRELTTDINNNGFDVKRKDLITVNPENPLYVIDGQHRLAILFHIYGPNTILHFRDNKLRKVTYGGDQSDS